MFEYFESLKNNPFGWKLCAETLLTDSIKDESAIFFCFQVIEDYIKTRCVYCFCLEIVVYQLLFLSGTQWTAKSTARR